MEENEEKILYMPTACADSLCQHCYHTNYLSYILCHPFLKHHPALVAHGWQLVGGCCCPVPHTQPALPIQLPLPGPAEENEDDGETDEEGDDIAVQVMTQKAVNCPIQTEFLYLQYSQQSM